MKLAVYDNGSEVLVFEVKNGKHLKVNDYFGENNRDKDDYDVTIVEAPLEIRSDFRISADQYHDE